jgi:hypothetical protein
MNCDFDSSAQAHVVGGIALDDTLKLDGHTKAIFTEFRHNLDKIRMIARLARPAPPHHPQKEWRRER